MAENAAVLLDVSAIQREDVALDRIHRLQVVRCGELRHGLRHPADYHVLAEHIHDLAMHIRAERFHVRKALPHKRHRRRIAHRPEKFLEVHWIHRDAMLLAWNENVLDVLVDRYQRTRLDVVVASVGDEMLDCLSRTRELLNLVEDDECVPLYEPGMCDALEVEKESVKVIKVLVENALQLRLRLAEIHEDVACIFVLGELLDDIALPYTTRSVYQERRRSVAFRLPFQKFVIYLPFHLFPPFLIHIFYHIRTP